METARKYCMRQVNKARAYCMRLYVIPTDLNTFDSSFDGTFG